MTDDIMKLLRGGVKVLTGGDSPQAQATGCNSLTDGIVRMRETRHAKFLRASSLDSNNQGLFIDLTRFDSREARKSNRW